MASNLARRIDSATASKLARRIDPITGVYEAPDRKPMPDGLFGQAILYLLMQYNIQYDAYGVELHLTLHSISGGLSGDMLSDVIHKIRKFGEDNPR